MTVSTEGALTVAAKLITDSVASDPDHREASKTFVSAATTVAHRTSHITNHQSFPGLYVITPRGAVKPCFLARKVTMLGPNNEKFVQLLTQGSNDPATPRCELIPLEVLHLVICLLDGDDITKVPADFKDNMGEKFTAADVADIPDLHKALPADGTQFALISIPACLVMTYDKGGAFKGRVTESAYDAMEMNVPGGAWWLGRIIAHDSALQAAVLHSFKTDKKQLGKKFLPPRAQSLWRWVETPFVQPVALTEDDEAELKAPLAALAKQLATIAGVAPDVPIAILGSNDNADDEVTIDSRLKKDSAAIITPRIPRKPQVVTVTEDDLLEARLKLAGMAFDEDAGKLLEVPLSTNVTDYLANLATKKMKTNAVCQLFETQAEKMADSEDFLDRRGDMPRVDILTAALILHSDWESQPLLSLDAKTTPKSKFRPIMLAADDATLVKRREAATDDRGAQEMLGEYEANMSSVNTSILYNQDILGVDKILTMIANNNAKYSIFYEVDRTNHDSKSNPLPYRVNRRLAKALTSRELTFFLKMCTNRTQVDRFLCWIVHSHDRLILECNYNTRQPTSVMAVARGDFSSIPTTKYSAVMDSLEEVEDTITKIAGGTHTVPHCFLATNYENATAKRRTEDALADARKKTKLDRAPTPAARPTTPAERSTEIDRRTPDKDKSGVLVWTGAGKSMPIPDEGDRTKRICAGKARKGASCRWGDQCRMVHEKDPAKWDPTTLRAWWDLVASTDGLDWDTSVNTAAIKETLGL